MVGTSVNATVMDKKDKKWKKRNRNDNEAQSRDWRRDQDPNRADSYRRDGRYDNNGSVWQQWFTMAATVAMTTTVVQQQESD